MDFHICSLRFDLQGIRNGGEDDVNMHINPVRMFNQVEISKVLHCDGLLFCVTKDNLRHLLWNPYLGQTRWIQPRDKFNIFDMHEFGYDKNHNHKILRFLDSYDGTDFLIWYEIYDCNTDSWRVLDVNPPDWDIAYYERDVSFMGNTYFVAREKINMMEAVKKELGVFIVCFDFTTERFGPRLPLPLRSFKMGYEIVTLSACVRDEKLALLYQRDDNVMEWITTKIEPNGVSWTKFFKVYRNWLIGFPSKFTAGSFFIDEEKKVAVASYISEYKPPTVTCRYQTAYIIGGYGYFKSVNIGEAQEPDKFGDYNPLVFSSYVPSLAQLQRTGQKVDKEIIS